jgi:hypothetical protein
MTAAQYLKLICCRTTKKKNGLAIAHAGQDRSPTSRILAARLRYLR